MDVPIMGFIVVVLSYYHPLVLRIAFVYLSACYEPRKRNDNAMGVLIVIPKSMLTIELRDMCANGIDRNTCRNVA